MEGQWTTRPTLYFSMTDEKCFTPGSVSDDLQIGLSMPKKRDVSPEELRARGVPLPKGRTAAKQVADNTMTSLSNRELTSEMGRRRTASTSMAMPKMREPLQTLTDKGIPTNTADPEELKKIRHWSRLFYATHDLIPLLIDIYSRFPVIGMDFQSKDTKITEFYSDMFLNQLNYEEFLPALGREHFTVGETNTLGHFHDVLGIWSKEEILNPDSIHVSQSMFDSDERVQLMVKELVDALRDPQNNKDSTEEDIRRRQQEYEMLAEHYPEMIRAAAQNEGLDISNVLLSRTVNKVAPGDLRGTPHLMRSFRTLMMEESLNAAQDAVADRLYSPLILATLGIPNLGDGEPWIPTEDELDDTRDLMDQALAADFRLMVHNFGLDIKSVFGRESVPRFDQDYARIDKKLMQAWGIGEALISGGGSSTYASSALNREFVTQMMLAWQGSIRRHMRKRMEVIAEAQEHYDYEMKGGIRKPIFREVVEIDEETGMEYTRKVPKLLIPDVRFQTLNLRDETQERQFLQTLKNAGVPISDETLAVNIPINFEEELERRSSERIQKFISESQTMKRAYEELKKHNHPIPPELANFMATQKADAALGPGAGDEEGEGEQGDTPIGDSTSAEQIERGEEIDTVGTETDEVAAESSSAPLPTKNRTRPPESDEQRSNSPRAAKMAKDPSSFGASKRATYKQVNAALRRMEADTTLVKDLVETDEFFEALNRESEAEYIRKNVDEVYMSLENIVGGVRLSAMASPTVKQAFDTVEGMLDQYELVFDFRPDW